MHQFLLSRGRLADVLGSEQLIPMLGLVSLQHALNPHSTLEKLVFLIDNAFMHAHHLTAVVSFGALAILVCLRKIKQCFPKYWFIYRLPEVFLVVVVSTSKYMITLTSISLTTTSLERQVRLGRRWH